MRKKERKKDRRNAEQETPGGTLPRAYGRSWGAAQRTSPQRLAPVIKRESRADPEGPPRGQHGHWRLGLAWGGRAGAGHGSGCTAAALRPGGRVGCSETGRGAGMTAGASGGGETC
jgi:hypothetical protein